MGKIELNFDTLRQVKSFQQYTEDFQAGLNLPWTGDWIRVFNSEINQYCFANKDINHSQTSSTFLTLTLTTSFTISFRYKSSSEANYDWFRFLVNGVEKVKDSSNTWKDYNETFPAGTYNLELRYSKDGSDDANDDTVYLAYFRAIGDMGGIIQDVSSDTTRIAKELFPVNKDFDTKRKTLSTLDINFDTKRTKVSQPYTANVNFDLVRRIGREIESYKSLAINIQPKSLSFGFSVDTYQALELGQTFLGQIKDLVFQFSINELNIANNLYSASGGNDLEEILNKPLAFPQSLTGLTETLNKASDLIGKPYNLSLDSFAPAPIDKVNPTYKDIISSFFGWTDILPHKQVNVYSFGDSIEIIQRGYEEEVIPIDKYSDPRISQKKIILLQNATDSAGQPIHSMITGVSSGHTVSKTNLNADDEPTYYINGTYSFGDASVTYSNGLVVRESHAVGGQTEVTTWSYDSAYPPARIVSKTTYAGSKTVETRYYYSYGYLSREVETTSEKGKQSVRIARHYSLGQGQWATVVEEDGKTVSQSIGQGAPSGDASAYAIQQYSQTPLTLTSSETTNTPSVPYAYLPGQYLGTSEFPVQSQADIDKIASQIVWLNGKIEEKVNLNVYTDRVITFKYRVLWQGHEYYLESNNAQITPRSTAQQISLVRWY